MSSLRGVDPLAVQAGVAFFLGVALVVLGVLWPRVLAARARGSRRRRHGRQQMAAALQRALPTITAGQEQNLRLAGITPHSYALPTLRQHPRRHRRRAISAS